MLSIIICSRTKTINSSLYENINNTIGCTYELVVINNSENTYSIFEAYNKGIKKSKGDYLCFIHDDIFIHTNGWGAVLERVFKEDKKIGLIGVAGSKIKTKMPSAWWDCPEDEKVVCIIQQYENEKNLERNIGFNEASLVAVNCIDGVFMAMRKNENIKFSTQLTGFHNYDLNISLEHKINGFKVMVSNQILIEHFSRGTINREWIESTHKTHGIYKDVLPLLNQKNKFDKILEIANAKTFIEECFNFNKKKIAFSTWLQLFYLKPLSFYHFKFLKKILIG